MFVILTYDVQVKQNRKLRKIAKRYLNPIQRSVFHGFLTEKQCKKMQYEIAQVINPETDSIVLYRLPDAKQLKTDLLGRVEAWETEIL